MDILHSVILAMSAEDKKAAEKQAAEERRKAIAEQKRAAVRCP